VVYISCTYIYIKEKIKAYILIQKGKAIIIWKQIYKLSRVAKN